MRKISVIVFILMITNSFCKPCVSVFDSTGLAYTKLLGFELENSTISDVFEKFGETEIYESGDAGEYSKRISYYLLEEDVFVTFDVTEVGGGRTIMQFILKKSITDKKYKTIPKIYFDKKDVGGLRTGMNKDIFPKKFGSKYKVINDRIYVTFENRFLCSEINMKKNIPEDIVYCDQSISLSAKIENNKIIEISVFRFTTY